MFLNHLYGGMDEPELKIIDVFICKLRKKLSDRNRRRTTTSKPFGDAAMCCVTPNPMELGSDPIVCAPRCLKGPFERSQLAVASIPLCSSRIGPGMADPGLDLVGARS